MAGVLADLSLRIGMNSAELQKGIDQAKGGLKSLGNAGKEIGNNLGNALSRMTGGLSDMATAGVTAFKSLIGGVKGFSSAFAATGIGAIIIAVTTAIMGLVAAFKRSGEAGDALEKVMGFLGGVLNFLIKGLVKVGEWLIKVFTDPKTAIKELWEAIKQNLVTRFEGVIKLFQGGWEVIKNGALGVVYAVKGIFDKEAREQAKTYFDQAAEGAKKVGEALVMIATGKTVDEIKAIGAAIKKAGQDGAALAVRQDNFEEARRKTNEANADLTIKLRNLQDDAANQENKSLEGKQKKILQLNEIIKTQGQIAANNNYIAQEAYDIEVQKNKQAGDTSDEAKQRESDLLVAVKNTQAEGVAAVKGATKIKTTYEATLTDANKKELEERLKNEEDNVKKIRSLREDSILANIDDERKYAETKLAFDRDNLLRESTTAKEQEAIWANYYANLEKMLRGYEKTDKEIADEKLKKQKDDAKDQLDFILGREDEGFEVKKAALDKAYSEGLVKETEYQDQLQAIRDERNNRIANTASTLINAISDFQTAAMNKELEAAGDNEAKKDEIRKKYGKKQKAAAVAQAIINGALAVISSLTGPPVYKWIEAAAVGIATAAQIAVIQSTPLAKGGIAYGQTLATVGEYPGARTNPEVIAPLDKLKNLINPINSGVGEVRFVIEQNQLVGILNDFNNKNIYF